MQPVMKEEIKVTLTNLPLLLYTVSIILHSIGLYLMQCQQRTRNQDIIIMHLSVSELISNFLDVTQNILNRTNDNADATSYVILINCCFIVVPFYSIIIVLTADRFLEVYLNIKYEIYFSKFKTVTLLLSCWCIGFIMGIVMLCMRLLHDTKVRAIIYKWIFPIFQGSFLIIATATYTYIYKQYKKSLKCYPTLGIILSDTRFNLDHGCNKNGTITGAFEKHFKAKNTFSIWKKQHNRSTYPVTKERVNENPIRIKRRNFFAPSLIVLTFMIFVIVPDWINLLYFYTYSKGSELLCNVLLCLYALGFIADAVIYIFLQKHVRNLLLKKFRANFRRRRSDVRSIKSSLTIVHNQPNADLCGGDTFEHR